MHTHRGIWMHTAVYLNHDDTRLLAQHPSWCSWKFDKLLCLLCAAILRRRVSRTPLFPSAVCSSCKSHLQGCPVVALFLLFCLFERICRISTCSGWKLQTPLDRTCWLVGGSKSIGQECGDLFTCS